MNDVALMKLQFTPVSEVLLSAVVGATKEGSFNTETQRHGQEKRERVELKMPPVAKSSMLTMPSLTFLNSYSQCFLLRVSVSPCLEIFAGKQEARKAGFIGTRPGAWEYRRDRRLGRGFTLIEVLIVVVILAILTAIALPGLATQSDLLVSAASRIVVGDLLYAQSQAIATGQNVSVNFTVTSNNPGAGSGSYILSNTAGTLPDPVTHQNTGYIRNFGSGALADAELFSLSLDNASNTVLVFNELGQPLVCPPNGTPVALANPGTIELASGSATVTLSIEPGTGNITVSAGN